MAAGAGQRSITVSDRRAVGASAHEPLALPKKAAAAEGSAVGVGAQVRDRRDLAGRQVARRSEAQGRFLAVKDDGGRDAAMRKLGSAREERGRAAREVVGKVPKCVERAHDQHLLEVLARQHGTLLIVRTNPPCRLGRARDDRMIGRAAFATAARAHRLLASDHVYPSVRV